MPPHSRVERAMRLLCPFVRPASPSQQDADQRHDPDATPSSWPRLHLPTNAHGWPVVLRRPCTFLYALLVGFVAALLSVFYSVSRIQPPDCPFDDAEPRTRRRPPPPTRTSPLSSISTSFANSSRSFLSFAKQRQRKTTPPQTIRASGHGLENVAEGEEVEMESMVQDDGSTDGVSEVDTVEDNPLLAPSKESKGKGKGIKGIFGRKQLVRQSSGSSRDDASTSALGIESPSTMGSTSSSSSSSSSPSSKNPFCIKDNKKLRRATTISSASPPSSLASSTSPSNPTRPPLFSASSAPLLTDEPISLSSHSSSDSIPSPPTSPPLNSKRLNPFRIFTRHHSRSPIASPLASPITSPLDSPPPSPILAPKMQRTGSCGSSEGRTGRSGGAVGSGLGGAPDQTGSSGLAMSDVVRA